MTVHGASSRVPTSVYPRHFVFYLLLVLQRSYQTSLSHIQDPMAIKTWIWDTWTPLFNNPWNAVSRLIHST